MLIAKLLHTSSSISLHFFFLLLPPTTINSQPLLRRKTPPPASRQQRTVSVQNKNLKRIKAQIGRSSLKIQQKTRREIERCVAMTSFVYGYGYVLARWNVIAATLRLGTGEIAKNSFPNFNFLIHNLDSENSLCNRALFALHRIPVSTLHSQNVTTSPLTSCYLVYSSTTSFVALTPASHFLSAAWMCSRPFPMTNGAGRHLSLPARSAGVT